MSRLRDAVYCLLALLAIPYWLWGAWRHAKYRQGWSQKLWGNVPEAPRDRVGGRYRRVDGRAISRSSLLYFGEADVARP